MLPVDEARAQTPRFATLATTDGCTSNCTIDIEASGGTATFTLTYEGVLVGHHATFTVPSDVGLTDTDPATKYVIEFMGDVTLTRSPILTSALLTTTFLTAGSGTVTYTVRTTEVAGVGDRLQNISYSGGTPIEDLPRSGGPLTFNVVASTKPTSVVSFTANNSTIAEDGGTSTVTLTLNRAVPMDDDPLEFPYTITGAGITVNDITVDGTTPADLTSGTITVAAGSATGTLDITAVGDGASNLLNEDDETMTIELGTLPPNSVGNPILITADGIDPVEITITDPTPAASVEVTIPRGTTGYAPGPPPTGSIAEADGSVIITVALDIPATTPVTLPFTIDTTGTHGTDYVVTSDACDTTIGSNLDACDVSAENLVFAIDERTKTITVRAIGDSIDDDAETVTIALTGTSHDGVTVDTANDRTVITITEVSVEPEEVKMEVETVATLVGAVQTGLTAGLVRSRFSVQPSSGVAGRDTPDANGATGGATTSLTLPDNPRDLADILGGLALEHTADADSGGQYAVWVRGQYTSMDGDPTLNGITVNYDGNSSGLGVGAEKSTGRYVAGVAVNWLATDLDISSSSDDTTLSKYEESLVMVAPYVSLRRGARTFWFSGGYGIGDADATLEEGEGKASADVEVSFASAGADFVLSERGKNRIIGGLSVLGTRKVVDPLNFAAADVVIPKITLNTFRAQGEITYSRTIEAGAGRVVRPYIGVATLHDAGDRVNDDSHAMDLRGGVDFDGTQFDVSLEASTELLREDHESWSVSGSARYQFAPSGRGASLSLDGIGGDASDIGLEGGYGMMMRQVHRDALLTPFAGIRHGSESGEFSSGMRLAVGDDMNADLRAARAFRNDEDTLKLNFRRTF